MEFCKSLLIETYKTWRLSRPAIVGAALSYYALFSLPAMLLVIIAAIQVFLGKGILEASLVNQIQGILGKDIASTVSDVAYRSLSSRTGIVAGIIGMVTILIGSLGAFSQIESVLNTMWSIPQTSISGLKAFFREKIAAFFMIIWIGVLLVLSLITSTIIPLLYNEIALFFPYKINLIEFLNPLLSFTLLTILFISIYAFLPSIRISFLALIYGGIATALLFLIGRFLIQTYLNFSFVLSAYGTASAIIAILLWAYYSSQVFLLGAAFTYAIDRKLKKA